MVVTFSRRVFAMDSAGGEDARVLDLRPNCEWCDRDLPPDATDARICTFECTFCAECVEGPSLAGTCPNCGGNFEPRPIRPAALLESMPPSPDRVINPGGPAAARS